MLTDIVGRSQNLANISPVADVAGYAKVAEFNITVWKVAG